LRRKHLALRSAGEEQEEQQKRWERQRQRGGVEREERR
jgi:hypothetical protein